MAGEISLYMHLVEGYTYDGVFACLPSRGFVVARPSMTIKQTSVGKRGKQNDANRWLKNLAIQRNKRHPTTKMETPPSHNNSRPSVGQPKSKPPDALRKPCWDPAPATNNKSFCLDHHHYRQHCQLHFQQPHTQYYSHSKCLAMSSLSGYAGRAMESRERVPRTLSLVLPPNSQGSPITSDIAIVSLCLSFLLFETFA